MTRSGYTEDGDDEYGRVNLWRANIERATKGKRGQRFFRDLVAALDAMPEKRLVRGELETPKGEVCALGALRLQTGQDLTESIRESEWDELGKAFNVAPMLAREVMFENDDDFAYYRDETPEARWVRMRKWAEEQLVRAASSS